MASRLTDKKKKKIIADYVQLENYSAVGKLNGVSPNTVKNIVKANAEIAKQFEQKKKENTADVLEYMDGKKDIVCEIVGKVLDVLNDEEKLKNASPSQLTTAVGTLIDKWTMLSGNTKDDMQEDALSRSLRKLGEEMESDNQ